jgi:peptide/nickel transport system permease protein
MVSLVSFLVRRILQGVLIILLVSFGIFAVLRLVPGDPARLVLGPMASDQVVEEAARQMGLRDPIPIQYVHWLGAALHGDMGQSYIRAINGSQVTGSHEEFAQTGKAHVLDLIGSALPYTLQLAGLALLFAAVIAIPLGIAGGMRSGRWPDKLVLYLGSAFVSIPNFWLSVVLALVLTAQLHLIPSIGYQGFSYTILPAFVIAIEMSPIFMRSLSSSVSGARQRSFVSLAEIRGLSRWRIFFGHILRNAAVPVLNLFGVQIGALLGGILIVEFIFNYPGLGLLTVQAVLQRDFPVIQGIAVLSAVLFVVINILVDLFSTWIDPRLDF